MTPLKGLFRQLATLLLHTRLGPRGLTALLVGIDRQDMRSVSKRQVLQVLCTVNVITKFKLYVTLPDTSTLMGGCPAVQKPYCLCPDNCLENRELTNCKNQSLIH